MKISLPSWNIDFLLLLGFVTLLNMPYALGHVVPQHDTRYAFEVFYYFYNQFYYEGTIPQWLPYGNWGLPSHFLQLNCISAPGYLGMVIGKFLRVENVLGLFKATLLLEQFLFLSGMYLLSRTFLKSRIVVLFVCVNAVLGMGFIVEQVYFSLRTYYLLPLTVYLVYRFLLEKRWGWLWLAGVTTLTWILGSTPYFAIVWLFILSVFVIFAAPLLRGPRTWEPLTTRHFVLVIGGLVLSTLVVWQMGGVLAQVVLTSRMVDGSAGIMEYFSFASMGGLYGMIKGMLLSVSPEGAIRVYYGSHVTLAAFLFFVWAAVYARGKNFYLFIGPLLLLVWFSVGGLFSLLAYWFPGVAFFRHLGHTVSCAKVIFLIIAGLGAQDLVATAGRDRIKKGWVVIGVTIFILDIFFVSGSEILRYVQGHTAEFPAPFLWTPYLSLIVMAGYFVAWGVFSIVELARQRTQVRPVGHLGRVAWIVLFGLLVLVDLGISEWHTYQQYVPLITKDPYAASLFRPHPFTYVSARSDIPEHPRAALAMAWTARQQYGSRYDTFYQFAQYDPCHYPFNFRPQMYMKRVGELVVEAGAEALAGRECGAPRLSLTSRSVRADSYVHAVDLVAGGTVPGAVVLEGIDEGRPQGGDVEVEGRINVRSFSGDRIEADVDVRASRGAWLVYRDAYHPWWKARVDGKSARVFPADAAFKAVYLDKGPHQVEFSFRSHPAVFTSYAIALFGLLMGLGGTVLCLGLCFKGYQGGP